MTKVERKRKGKRLGTETLTIDPKLTSYQARAVIKPKGASPSGGTVGVGSEDPMQSPPAAIPDVVPFSFGGDKVLMGDDMVAAQKQIQLAQLLRDWQPAPVPGRGQKWRPRRAKKK